VPELLTVAGHRRRPIALIEHNMNAQRDRLLGGLAAAWATAVMVAFVAGCLYAITSSMEPPLAPPVGGSSGPVAVPFEAVLSIGTVAAIVAVPIAGLAAFVLGLPIFRFWNRRGYSSPIAYLGAGALIAGVVAGTVAAAHYLVGFLARSDLVFGIVTIFAAAPLSALTVWAIDRRPLRSP